MKVLSIQSRPLTCCLLSIFFLVSTSGCSYNRYPNATENALLGGAIGAGSGVVLALVDNSFHLGQTAALMGGIGVAVGLVASAVLTSEDENQVLQEEVRRRSEEIREAQIVLDQTYSEAADVTKYGKAETKPWTERYESEIQLHPYQGPRGY